MTPTITRFIALICIPVIMLGLLLGSVANASLSTRKLASNSRTVSDSKDTGFLGQLTKKLLELAPSTTPTSAPNSNQGANMPSSNNSDNTSNSNNPTNTTESHVTSIPTVITTSNVIPTVQVPTTQAQTQPTIAPQATPTPIFTQLVVLGCYDFGLNYCRQGLPSNGSVYGGRLRVREASTGVLLASATLSSGGGATVTGLPIDKELEVTLLPPTDQPNYCGDREYVKFLSYKTYISVELDLYRDATPCITN